MGFESFPILLGLTCFLVKALLKSIIFIPIKPVIHILLSTQKHFPFCFSPYCLPNILCEYIPNIIIELLLLKCKLNCQCLKSKHFIVPFQVIALDPVLGSFLILTSVFLMLLVIINLFVSMILMAFGKERKSLKVGR